MEMNKKPWPLSTVFGLRDRIDTNPDYQRPAVWGLAQKQLLVDTILRGYDIPKFYWRRTAIKPDKYEVVDGQQRLRAIWQFQSNEISLPKDADPIDGHTTAGLRYSELPDELRMQFDVYTLDIVVMSESDEDEVREMFLRLQNGTTLKAQEKRNAMPGAMRSFVRGLAEHQFFRNCKFANSRYTYDHIAAQATLIELKGGPTNVRNADLNRMYQDDAEFDDKCTKAKKTRRVFDYLLRCFPAKTPELERFNVVSLYALCSHLLEQYVVQGREDEIALWFVEFEASRKEQRKLSTDDCDPEVVLYHEKTSHSTDAADSIRWRHEHLLRKLLEAIPDLELKDNQRLFTQEQRLAIFRRDRGRCQLRIKCEEVECDWDNWQADHVVPWSSGGQTIVSNGQVACGPCNAAKGAA
jgi:hypothetical protein